MTPSGHFGEAPSKHKVVSGAWGAGQGGGMQRPKQKRKGGKGSTHLLTEGGRGEPVPPSVKSLGKQAQEKSQLGMSQHLLWLLQQGALVYRKT